MRQAFVERLLVAEVVVAVELALPDVPDGGHRELRIVVGFQSTLPIATVGEGFSVKSSFLYISASVMKAASSKTMT